MNLIITPNAEGVNVTLIGSLDTLAAEQIEPQIVDLEGMASKPLTIDCTQLDYISSAGLRLLLRLRKAAAAAAGKVTLCSVNENVMEVLKVTHFDKMFVIK